MNDAIILFQVLLLLPALPVAVMSWRTSRRDRQRHRGLAALAGLVASAALVLAMLSLGLTLDAEERVDPWLTFGPPALTLVLCVWSVRRSMSMPERRARA